MTTDQARARIANYRQQLATESDPMRRAALHSKIRDLSGKLAQAEFQAKAAPLRRNMAGAY